MSNVAGAGRAAFQSRDFRFFQAGRLVSIVGTQMQSVAVGWHIYEITRRPLDLGFVGLAQFAPAALLSLVAGHVADVVDRKKLIVAYYLTMIGCALALFRIASSGTTDTRPIYAVLVVMGASRSFAAPASQALLPNLVPPEHFANAVAWSSSLWQLAAIAGPALGGAVYGLVHRPATVYAVGACCSLVALTLLLRVSPRRVSRPPQEKKESGMRALFAGVSYVWREKLILGAISLDLFAVLFGGAVALLPAYARDILHVGPFGFGMLRSAPAAGAAITAAALAHWPIHRRAGAWMLGCVFVFGIATIVFGISRSFALSLIALVIVGASDMVSVVVRHMLVQLATPDSMRGRVAAVNLVFIGASNELGEFESGATAAWLGIVPAVVAGGIGTCLVVVLWTLAFPTLRALDRVEDHVPSRRASEDG